MGHTHFSEPRTGIDGIAAGFVGRDVRATFNDDDGTNTMAVMVSTVGQVGSQTVYTPDHFEDLVHTLTARARALAASGERRIIGITGPPGSGKSTVCTALRGILGSAAAIVEMDGFHLSNEELFRLSRRDRKGAYDTFDVAGYVALLARLRQRGTGTVYAPRFDRDLEESIGSAVPIQPDTPLIITEGNYLLLTEGGWENVKPALDEVWYLDTPAAVLVLRLVERQRGHGKTQEDARRWTEQVDLPNAEVVAGARDRADLVVVVPTDPKS